MESLTGKKKSRKRKSSEGDNEGEDGSGKFKWSKLGSNLNSGVAGPSSQKEFIPAIFKASVPAQKLKKVSSEHILKPEELQEFKNLPGDTEAALLNLREAFPVEIFKGRLPPVMLYSQLPSLVHSRAVIDHELKKLAGENKILTFSLFSGSNYLIVFYSDFVKLKRKPLFQKFVGEVLGEDVGGAASGLKRSPENSKLISKEALLRKWKFEEDEIRQLVNSCYLGIHEGGYYCASLPAAGEFIKMYEKGKKAVIHSIKRAKFGEILQKVFSQRINSFEEYNSKNKIY